MSERDPSKAPKFIPIEAILQAVEDYGTRRAAARALGINISNVTRRIQRHEAKLAGQINDDEKIPYYTPGAGRGITQVTSLLDEEGKPKQFSVKEKPIADNEEFIPPLATTKRVSTLTGADGSITQQWHITENTKEDMLASAKEFLDGFKDDLPKAKKVKKPKAQFLKQLHNAYVLSDAHVGAMAWAPETGDDWDLKIAEDMLINAMGAMISQSPPAESCTVALLGDWTHYDLLEAVTTLSRNVIDADGRQPKMNKIAIRIARRVIEKALMAHKQVTLLVAEGNHDLIAAQWLRELFILHYEDEPRIVVIDEAKPYYAFLQGDVMHCWHHGHMKSIKDAESLVALFADEYRELWGQAKKVYVNTGHLHTLQEKEVRGAIVTQHPTLAGRTSYESRKGWGSVRQAIGSTFHNKYGRKGQVYVSPEMLEDL